MKNPNNCSTCDYKKMNGNREKGWCYMFQDEPSIVCRKHTALNVQIGQLADVTNPFFYVPKPVLDLSSVGQNT